MNPYAVPKWLRFGVVPSLFWDQPGWFLGAALQLQQSELFTWQIHALFIRGQAGIKRLDSPCPGAPIHLDGVPLHIVQRGHNRQPCFFSPANHLAYLEWLGDAARRTSNNSS